MKKTISYVFTLFVFGISIITLGCGYDNTLYNARKYFKSAQAKPLNSNGTPTPQAIDEYTRTIQKCGYILTEHPKSSQADNALFLLAKALFYKGNSQFQAKDQFLSLINNFPDSPYAPESVLYIAKIYRQINQTNDAENTLVKYIRNPETSKWHPGALLLLADFAVQDKDYTKAKYWLERLITSYPKSIHSREASFLLGINYLEQKDYKNSLKQFSLVQSTRGIKKEIKLDAMYYIALNHLYLNEIQQSNNSVKKLLKEEIRPDKLATIRVLLGRILLELNNENEALELLNSIIKNNSRSLASAEAYYRLAEYYFYEKKDINNALESYNKVKLESSASPFAEDASNKNKALTQISQSEKLAIGTNPQRYLDNRLEIADYYYNVLNLPDSAFVIFNKIADMPFSFQTTLDSLDLLRINMQNNLDSLIAVSDTIETVNDIISTDFEEIIIDSTSIDSLRMPQLNSDLNTDSLIVNAPRDIKSSADSIQTKFTKEGTTDSKISSEAEIQNLQTNIARVDSNINSIKKLMVLFQEEYIPYTMFVRATLIYNTTSDSTMLNEIAAEMLDKYPQNKYTKALQLLLEGKPVRIVDTALIEEEDELDYALGLIQTNPDSALVILNQLTNSKYPDIKSHSNFMLGWYFTFDQLDTLQAKPYFDKVFEIDRISDFGKMIQRFYNGKVFTIKLAQTDSLPNNVNYVDSLKKGLTPDTLSLNPKQEIPQSDNYKSDKIEIGPKLKDNDTDDIKQSFDFDPNLFKPKELLIPKPY